MKNNESHIFAIFGASGDLTKRKLVPALYSLFVQDLLPEAFALVGASRSKFTDDEFREAMKSAINEFNEMDDPGMIDGFIKNLYYTPIQFDNESTYQDLKNRLEHLREEKKISGKTIFY